MSQNDKKIILVTGGIRSGKSSFAQRLVQPYGDHVRYIATAQAKDEEMEKRIVIHRQNRPKSWRTLEEPIHLAKLFYEDRSDDFDKQMNQEVASLIDCITLWISNILLQKDEQGKELWETEEGQKKVESMIDDFLHALTGHRYPVIIVTNEVGWGGIEMNPLGRVYQDILGWTNQKISNIADEVYMVVSGIPVLLKGGIRNDP